MVETRLLSPFTGIPGSLQSMSALPAMAEGMREAVHSYNYNQMHLYEHNKTYILVFHFIHLPTHRGGSPPHIPSTVQVLVEEPFNMKLRLQL